MLEQWLAAHQATEARIRATLDQNIRSPFIDLIHTFKLTQRQWATLVFALMPEVDPNLVQEVVFGNVIPSVKAPNIAREIVLGTGLPRQIPGFTVSKACASSNQAITSASDMIFRGYADVVVAGGTESMSLIPMGGHKIAPNPTLVAEYPDVYLTTGLVAENHAREASISREEQDQFALESHQKAVAAIDAGRFDSEMVALEIPNHISLIPNSARSR